MLDRALPLIGPGVALDCPDPEEGEDQYSPPTAAAPHSSSPGGHAALSGGPRIPLCRPLMGDAESAAAERVIRSGWVTQGPEVKAFEQAFAAAVGSPHACAVSNCTSALHLALMVAGVEPGDEVITVSHTFVATANAIRHCGARPVFVDITPGTFNMDPAAMEAAITPRTRAIVCVHQMGMPADLPAILEVARRNGLPVIEDAACAAGSRIRIGGAWEPIGKPHGDVACFSLHPRKVITTGDGGVLTTARADWDERFRLLRQHGMSIADTTRHSAAAVLQESYPVVGYNYRMTDLQAAVGREQLRRLDAIVAQRRRLAQRYREGLAAAPGIVLPREPEWARSNWQSFCILLPPNLDQRAVMQYLLDRGIATRRGIMCCHLEPAHSAAATTPLPHSEQARNHGLLLPLYPQMTNGEQDCVIEALVEIGCNLLAQARRAGAQA